MDKELEEALRVIKIKCHPNSNPSPLIDSALDNIEQALITKSKKELVFDLIKKKCIGNHNLKIVASSDNYSVYCVWFTNTYGEGSPIEQYKLIEEEFDLLKEMLCDE